LLIESKIKDKEMGYVGAVEKVNPAVLEAFTQSGASFLSFSPISLYSINRNSDAPAR